MISENESWVVDTGDTVLKKLVVEGDEALTEMELAVHCFWVIDHAIRKLGSLDAMDDIFPNAVEELKGIAKSRDLTALFTMLEWSNADSEEFEDFFYRYFEEACDELKAAYERG